MQKSAKVHTGVININVSCDSWFTCYVNDNTSFLWLTPHPTPSNHRNENSYLLFYSKGTDPCSA